MQYAQTSKFVIYGAGQVGITLLRHLAAKGLIDSVLNFAVSDVVGESENIKVYAGVNHLSKLPDLLKNIDSEMVKELLFFIA